MQQGNPFDQFDLHAGPAGGFTITTPRDPRQVSREDRTDARAERADARAAGAAVLAAAAADRAAVNDAARLDMERRRLALAEDATRAKEPGKADLDSVRAEALDKIRLARALQQRSRDGWFATGFGASTMGSIGGTGAYDVRQDTETLKNAGALTRIMEMSKTNGGKNPLTPLSNSDFQALASSLSNLDTSQSDGQFQNNVQRVIDLYTRAYQGAGGTDLEGDLNPGKRKRGNQPSVGPAGIAPPSTGPTLLGNAYGGAGGGGGGATVATGDTRQERDPKVSAMIDSMIRAGASPEQINAALTPMGFPPVDAGKVKAAYEYLRLHPDYKGSFGEATRTLSTTAWNRFAASSIGTGIYGAVDAGLGGMSDELSSALGGGDLADLNARKQATFGENPKSALLGQAIGTIGAMTGLGAVGRGTGLAGRFAVPQLAGDMAFGALSGAGQSNDNRLVGTLIGGLGAGTGNVAGQGVASGLGMMFRSRPGLATLNAGRSALSRIPGMSPSMPIVPAPALSAAERTTMAGLNRAGPANVTSALDEASSLGVPMSPADTHPELRELAGAAVRRSPTASAFAEDTLIPRNRGQYDRFASAVARDLGPTTNIPQLSDDLTKQARADAGPLYDLAYAAPGASSVRLDDIIDRPLSMKPGLARARTIAQEEGRDPTSMGFDLDDQGQVMLTRVPSFQTLDYVKRGLDDILEPHRNPITGRLDLNETTRAINATKNTMLGRADAVNPAYADARAAYAGPVQSRDALALGRDAYSIHPDELGMQVGRQTPEHLGQMQLGYRSALADHAGKVRDASNPWEATLGSPQSRQRLGAMYPGNERVVQLLRTRELEGGLQQTTNAILGNSRTARNQIADQAFATNPLIEGALHAGAAVATHGASVPGTAARFVGSGLKDRMALGLGRRAIAKADELAPILMNVDPAAARRSIDDLMVRDRARQIFIAQTRPRRFGMFGSGIGSQAATAPINYWAP